MRMDVVLAALLFVACAVAQDTNISAINSFGIEMILLDSPAFITKLQASYHEGELFVFGDTTLRPIAISREMSGFTALPVNHQWNYPLIDLHTFFSGNDQYTVGVTNYDVDEDYMFSKTEGPYLPLVMISPPKPSGQAQFLQPTTDKFAGLMMTALRVDYSNFSDIETYYAGWISRNNTDVSFGVVRTHYNAVQTGGLTQGFDYEEQYDMEILYTNKFAFFSAAKKPMIDIIHNWGTFNYTLVVVADPNSRTVYAGFNRDDGDYDNIITQPINLKGYDMVSAALNHNSSKIYIGLASPSQAPGVIAVIDLMDTMGDAPKLYELPANCSNPKALALDEFNNYLYIGLNGYGEILRFDLNINNVTGYQRLPEWLHRSNEGFATHHHVYFATYEQHSKVFRVNKEDFCPARCPYWGYCHQGKCQCGEGFSMNHNSNVCEWTKLVEEHHKYIKVHGGEVALGILFMFAVIAAAGGWFMWFRSRRSSYQAV